jgi:uncharacterized protein YndB with AHSA1/START domain
MVTVRVAVQIPAARQKVWDELARIEDHVTWMMDATAIRFQSAQREGVGTRIECDTRVGPLRLTDRMEITEWDTGQAIGVRHSGAVSGSGRFSLQDSPGSATVVTWEERLIFPVWLGASVGAQCAKPLFALLWRGNLRRLGRRVIDSSESKKAGKS